MRDLTVVSEDVPLAVRDFGGGGQPVVLLHGLGRTLVDWSVFGPVLSSRHRTVAFDLRGHGESGNGAWSWAAALADIEAIARKLHPGTPAVVNLDGHGRRTLNQYVGIGPEDARRRIAAADERVKASIGRLSGPLPPPLVDGLLAQQRTLAAQFGAPEEMFVESINRALRREHGVAYLRPAPTGLGREILADAEAFDMFALYSEVRCPVLVVAGTEPEPGADQELMAAYRAGLRRDLERLAVGYPNVTVEFIKGGHGLLFEHPEDLANRIEAFLNR